MNDEKAWAITTHALSKQYGDRIAVDRLDMNVPSGVVCGFIGPNGAGKTSTMRMLVGLTRPTGGEGRVLGESVHDPQAYLPRVGALIEGPAFYPGLSGQDNLDVLATLGGVARSRIPAVLERVGLSDRARDWYKSYSLGMKQRLGIAAALLGEPDLLILDEPANGLDPSGIVGMRELLRSLNEGDRTVLVSSHLLSELQQIADWLVVIDQGRLVFQGPAHELLSAGAEKLVLACEKTRDMPRLVALLAGRGLRAQISGDRIQVVLDGPNGFSQNGGYTRLLAELNRSAMGEGITLTELTSLRPDLEDRYQSLILGDAA